MSYMNKTLPIGVNKQIENLSAKATAGGEGAVFLRD